MPHKIYNIDKLLSHQRLTDICPNQHLPCWHKTNYLCETHKMVFISGGSGFQHFEIKLHLFAEDHSAAYICCCLPFISLISILTVSECKWLCFSAKMRRHWIIFLFWLKNVLILISRSFFTCDGYFILGQLCPSNLDWLLSEM